MDHKRRYVSLRIEIFIVAPDINNETLIIYIGGDVKSYTTTNPGKYTGDLEVTVTYDEIN